jgi:hypothetical protein
MDIKKLENFLSYKLILDEDPQFLVDHIKNKLLEYLPTADLDQVQKAYEYARDAHK